MSVDFPILSDPEKKVAEAYGVLIPLVRVPKRWTFYIGPDGNILEIDKDVNARNAGPDMVAKLKSLNVPARR